MNLTTEMVPGISLLLIGAAMGMMPDKLCRKAKNIPQVRMLGVFLAFAGAVLVFIP